MKLKEGFILRQICGEDVVVGEGLAQVNFNKMLSLNESAAYLWKEVEGKDFDFATLANILIDNYSISREMAENDAAALLQSWKEANIIDY